MAERPHDDGKREHRRPVYQRRAFEWKDKDDFRHSHGRRHSPHAFAPQVNAGWFQRPYPYHLDYYRMRYGGSYAPYFGNLYGPPQVVTAPPYYGPYYGAGYDSGYPNAYGPNGAVYQGPVETDRPQSESATTPVGELPAP